MASAPVLASIFLIISGLFSSKKNFQKFVQDKWNLVFIFSSILMPLFALLQNNFIEPDASIVPLINNWEKSLTWVGLSNWLRIRKYRKRQEYILQIINSRKFSDNYFWLQSIFLPVIWTF